METIMAATTSVKQYSQTHEQGSPSLPSPPYLLGYSINGTENNISSVQIGSSFRRTGKRYLLQTIWL